MANETTGGTGSRSTPRASSVESDAEALAAQVEQLKGDISTMSATLASLVKSGVREGRATVERTTDRYMREGRKQADAAMDEAREYGEALETQITRNPFSAVLVALGLGFLVGLMTRR